MFKLVGLLHRRDGMSYEDFCKHWTNHHAQLTTKIPGLRRYTVAPITEMVDGSARQWDGIGELWFDDRAAWERAFASPEWELLREDLPNFKAGGPIFLCEHEKVVVG